MVSKEILNQYIDLIKEKKEIQEKIVRLENQISKIESYGNVKDIVKGGEGGIQHFQIEGFPSKEYSTKKTQLYLRKATLESLEYEIMEQTTKIEQFIANIDDSRIRRIINLRFIENKTWNEVADVIGGNNTEDSIKKAFYRFMESDNKSCPVCPTF